MRVRPDCLLRGYSVGKNCCLSVRRRTLRTSDAIRNAMRFSSNDYFFFFLAVFFAFFAFFAFLAMLPP